MGFKTGGCVEYRELFSVDELVDQTLTRERHYDQKVSYLATIELNGSWEWILDKKNCNVVAITAALKTVIPWARVDEWSD